MLLRLLIHYGFIYYSFFFSRNRTRYTVHLKYMYAAGVTEGGMGGVLGTFTYWKWEPSSSFSHMYVCVYKYCILYVCVLWAASVWVRAVHFDALLSRSLSLSLELQLPALLARVEGREGGRQTHSVVIWIAASLKRMPQSTPWTWWDRPSWSSVQASSWLGTPLRTCRYTGRPEPDEESPRHCGQRADR